MGENARRSIEGEFSQAIEVDGATDNAIKSRLPQTWPRSKRRSIWGGTDDIRTRLIEGPFLTSTGATTATAVMRPVAYFHARGLA